MVKEFDNCLRSRSAALMGQMFVRQVDESNRESVISSRPFTPESKELESGLPPFAVLLLRTMGPNHPEVAKEFQKLAVLYHKQRKYPEAEALYARALAVSCNILGESHLEVATISNNLARLYQEQKRYSDAEPLYHRSIAILEQILGPNHPKVATRLKNLAALYHANGEEAKAELFRKRSLEILNKLETK